MKIKSRIWAIAILLPFLIPVVAVSFFFNAPATPDIYTTQYTLSLHDALPIFQGLVQHGNPLPDLSYFAIRVGKQAKIIRDRKSTRLNSSHIEPYRMPSSA